MHSTLAALAGVAIGAAACAQPFVFQSLIAKGDAAPGGQGGVIDFLSTGFDLNETGMVVWEASMSGTAGGVLDNRMLGTSRVVDGLDASAVRGGTGQDNGNYTGLFAPRINDAGQVLASAFTKTGSTTVGSVQRFNTDATATTIVAAGDAVVTMDGLPLPGFVHRSFGAEGLGLASYDLDNTGSAVVRSTIASGSTLDDAVSYYREGTGLGARAAYREGRSIVHPGGADTYSAAYGLEAYGEGAFGLNGAFSTRPGSGRAVGASVFDEGLQNFTIGPVTGAGLEIEPGRFIVGAYDTNWRTDGSAVVNIETSDDPTDRFGTDAYAVIAGAGVDVFLSVGDAAPDGGSFNLLTSTLDGNDAGLVVFVGRSSAAGGKQALYAMVLGTGAITEVLRVGDALFGGELTSLSEVALDNQNRLVFSGAYRVGTAPTTTFIASTDLSTLIPAPGTLALLVPGVLAARRRR